MNIPGVLIVLCFLMLMGLGGFVLLYSVIRLTLKSDQSQLSLPGFKIELKGPAWLVLAVVGAIMLASPLIAATLQKTDNVTGTPPPSSVQQVRSIPDPNYESFRFVRDVSILDLRAATTVPWYTRIPGWYALQKNARIRPAILKNYMVVRKVGEANEIHLSYGASGQMDIQCLTQKSDLRKAVNVVNGVQTETWEVIADVSSVPIGQEFEIDVEATYWNSFSREKGDDYSTYAHNQTDPEKLSVMLIFPEEKPFRSIGVTEYAPEAAVGNEFQGVARTWQGSENHTYYWTTLSTRPSWYYKLAWSW